MSATTEVTNVGVEPGYSEEERVAVLSVRQLTWLRLKRNKLALFGAGVLIFLYLCALFAPFIAPYGVRTTHAEFPAAPPTVLHIRTQEGQFAWPPFVYGMVKAVDPDTFQKTYTADKSKVYPLKFFTEGEEYKLFGLIPTNIHLFLVDQPGRIFVFGTDRLGRDLFSRIQFGAQVSLTIGLVGVGLSLLIGAVVGVISGYYGGWFDNITQRIIEIISSFPQIPVWLALAAVVPANWSSLRVYFAISLILAFLSWGALARQIRGMVLALREEDYVKAALYSNASTGRIIFRHLLPNTASHLLVIATTAIPSMILAETALSFLGLGIRPPMTSWGVLLNDAQHVRVFLSQQWMMIPIFFVMITIIAYNFLGDGLRDAADPFSAE
jgi:peptide/nickel transport system permease protein